MFFRGVEGSNKVWTSKTSLSVSRQDFVEHGGRVISAAKHGHVETQTMQTADCRLQTADCADRADRADCAD